VSLKVVVSLLQSSLFGLMFALFVVLSTKYKLIQDSDNESNLFKSDAALIITAFLSAAGFVVRSPAQRFPRSGLHFHLKVF